jgi:glycosyltransferase involved in cell wall biosynthesis
MNPTVSIILPTFNRADFLSFAVESALSQTFVDFELIILDDASKDNSLEILSPYLEDGRIVIIRHPNNIGITANRNYGLSIARGSYIAMLDSDDVWLDRSKLQRQVDLLNANPEYALVGTFAKIIDEHGKVTGEIGTHTDDSTIKRYLLVRNPIVQSSVLLRKQALVEAGGYDASIGVCEDYDLWLRLGEQFKMQIIGEALTGYRKHHSNVSKVSQCTTIRSYRKIYERYRKTYPFAFIMLLKLRIKSTLFYLEHGVAA